MAAFNPAGHMLLGIRRDDGEWTVPGGHIKEGEDPMKGGLRELLEETGLKPSSFTQLGSFDHDGIRVFGYKAEVDGVPTFMVDPDLEMKSWHWVDVSNGIPRDIWEHLHGPGIEGDNFLGQLFGFNKSEHDVLAPIYVGDDFYKAQPEQVLLPTIVVVRHGETALNDKDSKDGERLRGWLDVHLNDKGRKQASQTASELASAPIGLIVSSDLVRAQETAKTIQNLHPDAAIVIDQAFRPWDMGDLHGKPIGDVIPVMVHHIKNDDAVMPGSSESFKTFQHRALNAFKGVMDETIATPDQGWRVITTHARDCRLIKAWLNVGCQDIDVIDKTPLLVPEDNVETGKYMVIQFVEGSWKEVKLGDALPTSSLKKMALADIKVGTPKSTMRGHQTTEEGKAFDYSHVLPKGLRKQYTLHVVRTPGYRITAVTHLKHPKGDQKAGYVWGGLDQHTLDIFDAKLEPQHKGKGLGMAMYEALMAHSKNALGMTHVRGEEHSSSAGAVHAKLAAKHGMKYKQIPQPGEAYDPNDKGHPYDNRYIGYSYALKAELPPEQWKYATGVACPHGTKVMLVDGAHVRNHFDSDFDQGGNGYRYKFIPHGEIWVDSHVAPAERPYVIEHECRESVDMAAGKSYEDAHDAAKAHEDRERHHDYPGELGKSEPADEVERMLRHPDANERTMALKMDSLQPHHLAQALRDPDELVWRAALRHPALDTHALAGLMAMKPRAHELQQTAALSHPLINTAHVRELYQNGWYRQGKPNPVVRLVAKHPKTDASLIRDMVGDGNGDLAVLHPNANEDAIRYYLRMHLHSPKQRERITAAMLLSDSRAPKDIVESVLRKPQLAPDVVVQGAASNPLIDPSIITDWLTRGRIPKAFENEAPVRATLVQNPQATNQHLLDALRDSHPSVRKAVFGSKSAALGPHHVDTALALRDPGLGYAAMASKVADETHVAKLAAHDDPSLRILGHIKASAGSLGKFEDDLGDFLGLQKAINPKHFATIVKALDPEGRKLVDHRPHMLSHPTEHSQHVEQYAHHVLAKPDQAKVSGRKLGGGITRKLIYETPGVSGPDVGSRYMVKPYHEKVISRVSGWMKHPIQGWAEMANQALYHAGGIGNLHQNVHVAEHELAHASGGWPGSDPTQSTSEPMLVVHMEPGMKMVGELPWKAYQDREDMVADTMAHNARKIGLMDFLTNNLDRHGGNLMVDPVTGKTTAIDHSRSFQYMRPAKFKWEKKKTFKDFRASSRYPEIKEDTIGPYLGMDPDNHNTSVEKLSPFPSEFIDGETLEKRNSFHDRQMQYLEDYKPTFEWWESASPKIKAEMENQLQMIRDPEIRAHVKRNFDARARQLDQMAELGPENFGTDWYKSSVPHYLPGELTDQEQDEADWRKRMNEKG